MYRDKQVIGLPQDYETNMQVGRFKTDIDLAIPGVKDRDSLDFDENDLKELGDDVLQMSITTPKKTDMEEEKQGPGTGGDMQRKRVVPQSVEKAASVARASLNCEYTPIMALNTFNYDWKIKVRIIKKYDIRNF